jgi:hypothetical protein
LPILLNRESPGIGTFEKRAHQGFQVMQESQSISKRAPFDEQQLPAIMKSY